MAAKSGGIKTSFPIKERVYAIANINMFTFLAKKAGKGSN